MKRVFLFLAAALCAVPLFATQLGDGPVTKRTSGTNKDNIDEDLIFGAGRTLTIASGGTLTLNGTLSGGNSGASLTLGQGANGSLAANLGLVPLIKVNNSTNNYTVALGYGASASNTTANYNTAVGYNALTAATTGGENTAVGAVALSRTTTGVQNVAIGSDALAFNTTGNYNTAVGWSSLLHTTTGTDNAAGGFTALQANASGSFNTAWGDAALVGNTTGSYNSAIGYSAGGGITTGTYNTFLGAGASVSSGTLTKAIAIGANVVAGASNVAVIGGAFGTADAVNVGVGTLTPAYPLSVVGNGYVSGSMAIGATAPTSAKLSVVGGNMALDDAAKLYWGGTTNAYVGIASNVMTMQAFSSLQFNTWNGSAYAPALTISNTTLNAVLAGNLTVSGTGASSIGGSLNVAGALSTDGTFTAANGLNTGTKTSLRGNVTGSIAADGTANIPVGTGALVVIHDRTHGSVASVTVMDGAVTVGISGDILAQWTSTDPGSGGSKIFLARSGSNLVVTNRFSGAITFAATSMICDQ